MRIELLHLDDALMEQTAFLEATGDARATDLRANGKQVRLWAHDAALNAVRAALPASKNPTLTFMGSGDFHHITALLLARLIEQVNEPFTIIHFDNHPDWVSFKGGMHCGSWVNRALASPQVAKVITLGVCSNDLRMPECKGGNLKALSHGRLELFPYQRPPTWVCGQYGTGAGYSQQGQRIYWHNIAQDDEAVFFSLLLSRINTDAIYITVDKDVLDESDAITNWDQGKMRLPALCALIQALGEKFRIIGADVVGDYSAPDYAGDRFSTWKKRAEIWLDQPHRELDPAQALARNEASNLALLHTFSEVIA